MQITAETRWFFEGLPPPVLWAWFHDGALPPGGGGDSRTDLYLLDTRQVELGVKQRGRSPGVEIKGLIGVAAPIACAPFASPIQLWSKWSSDALALARLPTVSISKKRWLRTYDTTGMHAEELALDGGERMIDSTKPLPAVGCNVELTVISLPNADHAWSTLGFEAFGFLGEVELALRRTVDALAQGAPDILQSALNLSYPGWLQHVFGARE